MNLSNRNVKQKEQNEANAVASHVQAKLNFAVQQKLSTQAWNISLAKCPELQCLHRQETHQFTFNDKPKVWKGFYRWSNQHTEMKSELGWTRTFFKETIPSVLAFQHYCELEITLEQKRLYAWVELSPSVLLTQSWTDDISKENKTPNFLTLKYQNHWKTLCAIIMHVTIYNNHTKFESN